MITPTEKREIERLLDGLWNEIFFRFDNDISTSTASHIATQAEKTARRLLEQYFHLSSK